MSDEDYKINSMSLPHCFNKGGDSLQIKLQSCCGLDKDNKPCSIRQQCGFYLLTHEIL
jgi:hypothetical protein